ncbi:MAG TPA: MFS transporter [Candidatus Limnocylindrales bacterium]|nr:MFS transporter [Candidatus Limnocylindrales bacterium]
MTQAAATVRPADTAAEPTERWTQLVILGVGMVLAMSPSFAAAAVAPILREEWTVGPLDLPFLTVVVQLGFAVGAIGLAVIGAPDVIPAPRLFAAGAIVAAIANLGFGLIASDPGSAVPFRLLTGVALAAVYPVAMKMGAGWFRRDRGLAIGVVNGALTVGVALPFLFRALGAYAGVDWRPVVVAASVAGLAGAALVGLTARTGPLDVAAPRFSPAIAAAAFREPSVRLAATGYFGHMWELFAMWTWIPIFLLGTFAAAGVVDPAAASLTAFAVVAAGGVGSAVAGAIADRVGRTATTIAAMATSATSAVVAGILFGAPIPIVVIVALVWGVSVVADSAQFSSAISELAPPGTSGSALSVQTALGFTLTSVTILGVGLLDPTNADGWRLAWIILALGPVVGIVAMARLRGRPDATKMANGHR